MITTKRQIRKDTDRYGGFGTESMRSPLISDYDRIGNIAEPSAEHADYKVGNSLIMTDTDINISNAAPKTEVNAQAAPQSLYTTLGTEARVEQQLADVPPRPVKEEKPREREDILPTVKTRKYATEKTTASDEPVAAPTRRERRGLDSRTKVLLCVYIAVALVLAIAVIATGVSISNASVQADEMAVQISRKQAVIAEQEAELAGLIDEDVIRQKAIDMGMVPVDDGAPQYKAPASETYDYPEADPHTNGFDKVCDWLSKITN